VLREYERAVVFRLGRLVRPPRPWNYLRDPRDREDAEGGSPHHHDGHPAPGRHQPRQRVGEGERGSSTSGRRSEPRGRRSRELPLCDVAARADHAAQHLWAGELDELLAEREKINSKIQTILDAQTEPWGIKVVLVELKHIDLPESMQRAMARQAEAERERRAKVIAARASSRQRRRSPTRRALSRPTRPPCSYAFCRLSSRSRRGTTPRRSSRSRSISSAPYCRKPSADADLIPRLFRATRAA